jgi:hypothetical protein
MAMRRESGGGPPPAGRRVLPLLLALIAGALLPWGALAIYVSARDPLPPSCQAGLDTTPPPQGTFVYSVGPALWLARADLTQRRKLVDYGPSPAAPAPASPGPASPPASPPAASPEATPSASPAPGRRQASILAAALSPDHTTLAFLVLDPPDSPPGHLGLRLLAIDAPDAKGPVEGWSGDAYVPSGGRPEVSWIGNGAFVLLKVGYRVPAVDLPTRLVVVVAPGQPPALKESGPEPVFVASLHSVWPETRDLLLPADQPRLDNRIDGAGMVIGLRPRQVSTPLLHRTQADLVTGRAGSPATGTRCTDAGGFLPVAVSPDGRMVALTRAGNSYLLDLSPGHGAVQVLSGNVLFWG